MNIIDKRASNPAAALDGTELVYVAQLGADAVTTVQDIQYFATNGFLLITTAASTYVAKNAPITGATKTKITYNTDGLITSGADATTADIADSPNRRYITDAQQTVLNNTSNTNSGDETTATIKTKLGAASSTADGYLTSTDWTTFNGKQEPLADVITANTYGSSTQYPIVTVNAKGIVTGVTLQTVPLPTFTDANFSVQKAGSPSITASWSLTALTASRVHTYPDKAIDFGDLPSVATNNGNVLGGTRTQILGGYGNTVSGTQNLVANSGIVTASGSYNTALNCNGLAINITGSYCTAVGYRGVGTLNLSGTGITTIGGAGYNTGVLRDNTILLGTSTQSNLFVFATAASQRLNALYGTTTSVPVAGTIYATIDGSQTLTNLNCLLAVTTSGDTSSHEVEFIVSVGADNESGGIIPDSGVLIARRRIHVYQQSTSETFFVGSMQTVGTDVSLGTITGTFTPTLTVDTVNNRLVCSVVRSGGVAGQEGVALSVRTVSHHTR